MPPEAKTGGWYTARLNITTENIIACGDGASFDLPMLLEHAGTGIARSEAGCTRKKSPSD